MTSEDSGLWLVKSSGRILGPFEISDIGRLLRSKEIALHDEASLSMRRWHMIRDHVGLSELVEAVRADTVNLEDITTNVEHLTGSLTEPSHEHVNDEITADTSEYQAALKEIVYENLPESASNHGKANVQGRFQVSTSVDERRIKDAAEQSSRFMWLITLSILLVVIGSLVLKRQQGTRGESAKLSVHAVKDAQNAFQDGDYKTAAQSFKRVLADDPSRREIWFPLGLIYIQQEGQTVEGRRLINQVLEQRVEFGAPVWNALGLADAADRDWAKAEVNFKKALEADPGFLPAIANLGAVALQAGDFVEAKSKFDLALAKGMSDGAVLLQLVEATAFLAQSSGKKELLSELDSQIKDFVQNNYDYQQELLLARAYIAMEMGKSDVVDEVKKVLDVDPKQTDDYRHNIFVYRQMAGWQYLNQWSSKLLTSLGLSPFASTLAALAQHKLGQDQQAKNLIDRAVAQSPKDPLIQAVYAYILKGAGLSSEASVALGRAVEGDRRNEFILPVLLQARFCQEQGDLECTHNFWMKVLEINPHLISANVGMAAVYLTRGAPAEAKRKLKDIHNDSNYRPYLLLRRTLGDSGAN